MKIARGNRIAVELFLLVWVSAFAVACRLPGDIAAGETTPGSVIGRLLTVSRTALGADLFERADVYFHQGVDHARETVHLGIFQEWARAIRPDGHRHLDGNDVLEIMPWLRFAVSVDPQNLDAYLTAAYWLTVSGEFQAAEQALREALLFNPGAAEIYLQIARVHMAAGDPQAAARPLDAALRVVDRQPAEHEDRLLLTNLLNLRGFIYALAGDVQGALRCYREQAGIAPGNEAVKRRIRQLEADPPDLSWVEATWRDLVEKWRYYKCDHDHGHHNAHECDHGGGQS